MNFGFGMPWALGILAAIALPLIAHLLRSRKPQTKPFPAAHLLTAGKVTVASPARLAHRWILGARIALVLGLALLAAAPWRNDFSFHVDHERGASVALAIVLDDSMSMRISVGSQTAFERAQAAATSAIASLQAGDAVAIVAAGRPPRALLPATGDFAGAREALDALLPGDRSTDLDGALNMAAEMLASAPQQDRRIVVLSDLLGMDASPISLPSGIRVDAPLQLPSRTEADCGIQSALRVGAQLQATILCVDLTEETDRQLAIVEKGVVQATHSVRLHDGPQVVWLPAGTIGSAESWVRLTSPDALPSNDGAPIAASRHARTRVGLVAPSGRVVVTGGGSPVELALRALEPDAGWTTLASPPEEPPRYADFDLLSLDDVPGLSAGARTAMGPWLREGGTVLLALGPESTRAPLGSNFEPLLMGGVTWEQGNWGLEMTSLAPWAARDGLASLPGKVRASFTVAPEFVQAKWTDGAPFLASIPMGRGLALVLGTPLDAASTDFVLRPAMLSIIGRALRASQGQEDQIEVGEHWRRDSASSIQLTTWSGTEWVERALPAAGPTVDTHQAGRYRFLTPLGTRERIASVPADEFQRVHRGWTGDHPVDTGARAPRQRDLSPTIVWICLACIALELIFRWITRTAIKLVRVPASRV